MRVGFGFCREKILARGGHPWKRTASDKVWARNGSLSEGQPEVARVIHVARRDDDFGFVWRASPENSKTAQQPQSV